MVRPLFVRVLPDLSGITRQWVELDQLLLLGENDGKIN
jgi:hypothetical protein